MQKKWGKLIDHQQLESLSGGDEAFEAELLDIYLQDMQQQLQQLELVMAAAKWNQAGELAHYIKGASANVGAVSIAAIAADIETVAGSDQPESMLKFLAHLRQQVDALRACR